ncbi:uncharacterized protein LOC116338739 [Contarinia nasturtii]|uniref:uncharacterized protein LOC116338739 n=1 Tax=Contarinia nasturtii TaxID=265458 RepID=UPI0012D385DA|nr:uncharacterized protein LOC116338739 [Contarinia nasturtii]
MASSIVTVFLIFRLTILVTVRAEIHASDFEQYEIDPSSGIFFEELGSLQLYSTEWTFVTYVNLSHFAAETEYLDHMVLKIQNFCEKIHAEFALAIPNSYCDHTMPQLLNLLDDVREYSAKWFLNHELPSELRFKNDFRGLRRKKRGLLGGITKQLFGTLSEDEGVFYMEQINALKSENFQHLLMAEKQTTLFQESLKVLNNTMQSQHIQNVALQKQFDDLSYVLKNATIESTLAQVSGVLVGKLSELMQYASYLIIGFREKQRYFFEAITTKSKSFQLIPPRKFMNELERVSLLVARQGLLLPMVIKGENLAKFYQITSTEGRIVDNNLVVRFSIPLVDSKKFTLYKATSAPHRNDTSKQFDYIVPRNEYIGVDSFKEKFVTMTLDELKNCHRTMRHHLVCKQTFPLLTANNHLGCEINLLRNTNVNSSCDFRTTNLTDELWVQLQQPNTYLYTLPKELTVTVICPTSRNSIFLEGTGVISVENRCRIKTDRVEIVAFQSIESNIFRNFTIINKFDVNITSKIEKAKQIKSPRIPILRLLRLSTDDTAKISDINDELNGLQMQNAIDKASAMSVLNSVINNGGSIGQIVLALAIIAIAIVVVFTFIKYSLIKSGNIFIFILLVTIATATVLYFI